MASGQDYLTDLANRLDRLKNEPEVRQKLNQVLMDAYEAKYNEKIEVEPKEDEETDGFDDEEFKDRPKEDEKPHWETHPGEIMPFKVLHESSKTVSKKGHPYVKCQSCGKALNSMSLGSFWQHVDTKKCYPVEALEFWKEEHKKTKAEREESKKAPMEDNEAVSEKKRKQIAKEDGAKKRKEYFDAHYERFRYKPESSAKDPPADKETTETKDEPEAKKKPEKKAEVKKIPKRPVETETSEKERSPTRAPIDLRSRSPARKSKDEGRAGSALAESKGRKDDIKGAKKVLAQAAREAAEDVERRAKRRKSSSPKPREHSPGGGVTSGSDLDFLGNLSNGVDTVVWAAVDSGAATSCLPKGMAQSLELAMKPVDEKPFTNSSGQPVQVHGLCNPVVTMGEKGGPQVSGVGQFRAMDVAKPLLSVSKLVENGWTATFGPQGSFLQRGAKRVPVTLTGGVFKIAMDFQRQPAKAKESQA